MQSLAPFAVSTAVARTLGALIYAALLFWFVRRYQRTYLAYWAWGWTAYALSLALSAARAGIPDLPSELVLASRSLGMAGALLFVGLAWLGARDAVGREAYPRERLRLILIGLAAFGMLLPIALGGLSLGAAQLMIATGLRTSVEASLLAVAALTLWRRRADDAIGLRLLAVAFTCYALIHLQYPIQTYSFLFGTGGWHPPDWLNALSPPVFLFMGTGMLVLLLEEEREAAMEAAERAEHLAYHDPLTGLPNRKLFVDRLTLELAQARRTPLRPCAVIFLDLDRFKVVNDSLGHAAGDRLLQQVAQRVSGCTRTGDTTARLGGDEFALILPGTSAEGAGVVAEKILRALHDPVMIDGREIFATASLGIGLFPDDGADAETLSRNADAAMYRAKERGRDTFRFHRNPGALQMQTLDLESALRRATERNELRLHYQPIVEARTGRVRMVEALMRWQHPEWGLVQPDSFLRAAEATGLITQMGSWALATACAQLAEWLEKTGEPDLRVAVNLSARHFAEPRLVDSIRDVVESYGVPPGGLELEITESTAMSNVERTVDLLGQLKALGVRIAVDDFGAGYSAMSYLRLFPLDTLKIDRSFVAGVTEEPLDAAIVSALVHLGHTIGLQVIAEGVETTDQLAFIQDCGADLIQGYLLGRPMPAEEVTPLLTAREPLSELLGTPIGRRSVDA